MYVRTHILLHTVYCNMYYTRTSTVSVHVAKYCTVDGNLAKTNFRNPTNSHTCIRVYSSSQYDIRSSPYQDIVIHVQYYSKPNRAWYVVCVKQKFVVYMYVFTYAYFLCVCTHNMYICMFVLYTYVCMYVCMFWCMYMYYMYVQYIMQCVVLSSCCIPIGVLCVLTACEGVLFSVVSLSPGRTAPTSSR